MVLNQAPCVLTTVHYNPACLYILGYSCFLRAYSCVQDHKHRDFLLINSEAIFLGAHINVIQFLLSLFQKKQLGC